MACCGRGMSPRPNQAPRVTRTPRKIRGTVTTGETPSTIKVNAEPQVIHSSRKAFKIPKETK